MLQRNINFFFVIEWIKIDDSFQSVNWRVKSVELFFFFFVLILFPE